MKYSVTGPVRALACTAALGVYATHAAPAGAVDATQSLAKLQTITVTARRFAEHEQDVPASLAVFTPSTIEAANVRSVRNVVALVPNASYSSGEEPGQVFFNVRGIGQVRNTAPAVAVILDGVQLFDVDQITQDLYDLQSIQFLKGPQGAIYGRDAIGGAIVIATRAPASSLSGWGQADYGTGNDRRLQGGLSSALVPQKLWFRAAGSVRRFDGDINDSFLDQDVNGVDSESAQFGLIGQPTDRLRLDLEASGTDMDTGAAWYSFVSPGTDPNAILPIDANVPGRSHRLLRSSSLKADYSAAGVKLTSISALSISRNSLNEDFDFSPLDLLTGRQYQRHQAASEELRLASTRNAGAQWLVGTAYYDILDRIDSQLLAMPGAGGTLFPFPIPSATVISETASSQLSHAYAVFGQVRLHPWQAVRVSGALRYDHDHVRNRQILTGARDYADFSAVQPQVTASYSLTPEAMVYVSAGRGFRAGGFNASSRITGIYKSETDWSYELGTKTSWLDDRLQANVAAYHTEDRDRQIYIFDQLSASETVTNPVRRARIDGIELDLKAVPLRRLEVSLNGGLQSSRIEAYDTSAFAGLPAAGNFTGNRLPLVPTYTYSSAVQYTVPAGNEIAVTARVEFIGSGGDYFWDLDNRKKRSPVNDVNLRLAVTHGRLMVSAHVEDLTDEKHIIDYEDHVFSGSPLGDFSLRSPGLRAGLTVRMRF